MSKKLTRHGNSLALIIDKPLLRMLGITEKTKLELLIEEGTLIVRPSRVNRKPNKAEVKKIAQEIMEEYKDVFQKLAK